MESIGYIQWFLDGVSEKEFYKNVEKQDAVLRRLEIIGEAVKHTCLKKFDKIIPMSPGVKLQE